MKNSLLDYLKKYYSPSECPALFAQFDRWSRSRPLAGTKILDATPVFRNTMMKYAALLAAGTELTVSANKDIPFDPEILHMLPDFGIRIADEAALQETFDLVADCAGRHIHVCSRYGYAELTRSGLEYYRDATQPVFSVDSGILKRFETAFGTGESFVRAMKELGYADFSGKTVVIFGGGKVGCGTAYYSARAGAGTVIVDKNRITPPAGVDFVNAGEQEKVHQLVKNAWCVVSATGLPDALASYVPDLQTGRTLIANMGVEDEFGSTLPASAVLANKKPLNFILPEPTAMRYIDPSMALSNEALLRLFNQEIPGGINPPPAESEMMIIEDIRRAGTMKNEIELILKGNML